MMTLDPVADAAIYYGAIHAHNDAQERAEAAYVVDFMKACQRLDANATAWFAPMVVDWDVMQPGPHPAAMLMPRRLQTLSEVLADSLTCERGPGMAAVMQLLLNVAFGADLVNQPRRARELLAEMANAIAAEHVTVED